MDDEEEAIIAKLLAPCRATEGRASASGEHLVVAAVAETRTQMRSRLVLDAACGGCDSWSTNLEHQETDFLEERSDGWAASVSVIVALRNSEGRHMHDETGSGRVDKAPDADTAEVQAAERAVQSARHRLAKRAPPHFLSY